VVEDDGAARNTAGEVMRDSEYRVEEARSPEAVSQMEPLIGLW